MSKYSHYEMCEKIFGQRYKWNEQKQDYELYSRTDMWNKLIEQQDKIAELQQQLELTEKALELACERVKYFEQMQDREMGVVEFFGQEIDYDLQSIIEQYKKQAEKEIKEMMKDE